MGRHPDIRLKYIMNMEENAITNAPIMPQQTAAPAPAPPPVMAPAPAYPSPAAPVAAVPSTGGASNTLEFLKGINWLEVTFMVLGAVGLYSTIYYYRYKLKEDKVYNYDMQRQLDKINQQMGKISIATSNAQQPPEQACTASMDGGMW